MTRSSGTRVFWMSALLLAPVALAAEPTVSLYLEVVHASHHGEEVDPSLVHMKEKFTQEGFTYSNYKRLSSQHAELTKNKSAEVALPDGRTVKVKLEDLKSGMASVRVSVAPLDAVYQLGREGSAFMLVGTHNHGVLIFVLSPKPSG